MVFKLLSLLLFYPYERRKQMLFLLMKHTKRLTYMLKVILITRLTYMLQVILITVALYSPSAIFSPVFSPLRPTDLYIVNRMPV